MSEPLLHIVHLYPVSMSTYGDRGNVIALERRLRLRGCEVAVHGVEVDEPLPSRADMYFFGGGQDVAQATAGTDLQAKRDRILADVASGVPLLAICGGYQLLGGAYYPSGQDAIPGAGLFPVITRASSRRMIGNLIVEADPSFGLSRATIVGFENHSGQTSFTDPSARPLGRVRQGNGNNGDDHLEGCVVASAVGCYLHGSLLPKNPHLADWFVGRALERAGIAMPRPLPSLDDSLAWQAHEAVLQRYG